jgi:hypothetical protein
MLKAIAWPLSRACILRGFGWYEIRFIKHTAGNQAAPCAKDEDRTDPVGLMMRKTKYTPVNSDFYAHQTWKEFAALFFFLAKKLTDDALNAPNGCYL